MGPVIAALVGLLLLVALAAAVAWQERRRPAESSIVYGVEDSIDFIRSRLGDRAAAELSGRDVRRILEWSVRYLQDPVIRKEPGNPPVAGSVEAGEYVQRGAQAAGHPYDGDLIMEVLALQIEYLRTLGAVAGEVAPDVSRGDEDLGRG